MLNDIPTELGFQALIINLKSHLNHSIALEMMDEAEWRILCFRIEDTFQITTQNESSSAIGAYYTPKSVANFICRLVISSYIQKKLKSMKIGATVSNGLLVGLQGEECETILKDIFLDIKILDNSIGLGEFLIAAIEYLTPFYVQLLQAIDNTTISINSNALKQAARSLILDNNIYGVEICPASVILAKIRLWFLQNQEIIPKNTVAIRNPDSRIKQANALSAVWSELFPKVVRESQGFSIVIGNPPYIKLDRVPNYKDVLKADKDIFYNQGDLTHHFILRSLQLLEPGGMLGYIIARYFLEAKKADKIRDYLRKHSTLNSLIDLGPLRVFGSINTRSLILVATNSLPVAEKLVLCGNVSNQQWALQGLVEALENLIIHNRPVENRKIKIFSLEQDSEAFNGSRWMLVPQELLRIRNRIRKRSMQLRSVCEVGKGMESGFNKAYTVSQTDAQRMEAKVLRKRPKTKDIRRFLIRDCPEFFVFPENIENPADYPVTISHLLKYKNKLALRHKKPKRWFDYSAPQNKELFMKDEKILVPYTSVANRFAIDTQKRIGMTDVYCITMKNVSKDQKPLSNKPNIRWILGILNSRVAEFFYLTFIAKRKKNEFEYLTSMGEIPIPKIDQLNPREKKMHDLMVNMVEEITQMMEEWDQRRTNNKEVSELKTKIFNLEKRIDSLVYEQYRLTVEDQAIIDSYFKCNDPDTYFRLLDKFEPRMHF